MNERLKPQQQDPSFFTETLEALSDIKSLRLDDESWKRLLDIAKEQEKSDGKRFIFAPNHLIPRDKSREQTAIADDFPVLNKVLREAGITKNIPIQRGDSDMRLDGLLSELVYSAKKSVFSALGRAALDSMPLSINRHESSRTKKDNTVQLRRIVDTLNEKSGNITMYPYGNWFKSGEQDFSDEISMPEGAFVKQKNDGEAGYDEWRTSLKPGVFAIARMTGSPVVPVYIENREGNWSVCVGESIEPPQKSDIYDRAMSLDIEKEMAMRYMHEMQRMKKALQDERSGK